jgi:glucose-6-phosphate 1-dehydrogenase
MQPHEAMYMKTNVKTPGFKSRPIQSELEINYDSRFFAHTEKVDLDAYTRLIFDAFVGDDELRRAWEIFTLLLHTIEKENIRSIVYKEGSRGPKEADESITHEAGYIRNEDYVFYDGGIARKTGGADSLRSAPAACKEVPPVPESEWTVRFGRHGTKLCAQHDVAWR